MRNRRRSLLALLLIAAAAAGAVTRIYAGPGAEDVRGSLGGFFYVLFWCLLALLLVPRARPGHVALAVLSATCLVEFSQLFRAPLLDAVRGTVAGGLLLGGTFSGADFPFYFAGCAAAWIAGRRFRHTGEESPCRQ